MPSLPQLRHHKEDASEAPPVATPMIPEAEHQDILALLRIAPQTEIPESVITAAESGNVQFRTSTPEGYLFHDVEEWHGAVVSSLKWFSEALHRRDLDVVRLATEVDRAQTDKINQKYEMEWLSAKVEAAPTPQGAPAPQVTPVSAEDNSVLLEQIRSLQVDVERYRAIAESQVLGGSLSDEERVAFNELSEWAAQVEVAYAKMEADLATAQANLANAQSAATSSSPLVQPVQSASSSALSDEERQAYTELQEWAVNAEAAFSQVNSELDATREELASSQQYSSELDAYITEITPILNAAVGNTQSAQQVQQVAALDEHPYYAPDPEESRNVQPSKGSLSRPLVTATYDEDDEDDAPAVVTPSVEAPTSQDPYSHLFDEMQRDIDSDSDAPELGKGVRFESEVDRNRNQVVPGAPLRSIPEGADPNDY